MSESLAYHNDSCMDALHRCPRPHSGRNFPNGFGWLLLGVSLYAGLPSVPGAGIVDTALDIGSLTCW